MPFTARRAAAIYRRLQEAGVSVWLDGGWGVDALLGRQTRVHADLDIIVEERNLAPLRAALAHEGFSDQSRCDTRDWNFVLANARGEEVDVHVINVGPSGDGIYGPPSRAQSYPAASLDGSGRIAGTAVKCLTADYQIESHRGYTLRDRDFHDVQSLAADFGLELPPEYRRQASAPK